MVLQEFAWRQHSYGQLDIEALAEAQGLELVEVISMNKIWPQYVCSAWQERRGCRERVWYLMRCERGKLINMLEPMSLNSQQDARSWANVLR